MKRVRPVVVGIAAVLVGGTVYLASAIYGHVYRTIPDCYAQWATADMIVAFSESNGRLPESWEDLSTVISKVDFQHTGALTFPEIQKRIAIDFGRLPELGVVRGAGDAIPEIITTASGRKVHWSGAEPNLLVYEALKRAKTDG